MADLEPPPPPDSTLSRNEVAEAGSWHRMAGLGMEFVAAVGVFTLLGWWADRSWGTSPWLTLAGCGLGFVGGLWNMVKAARKFMG